MIGTNRADYALRLRIPARGTVGADGFYLSLLRSSSGGDCELITFDSSFAQRGVCLALRNERPVFGAHCKILHRRRGVDDDVAGRRQIDKGSLKGLRRWFRCELLHPLPRKIRVTTRPKTVPKVATSDSTSVGRRSISLRLWLLTQAVQEAIRRALLRARPVQLADPDIPVLDTRVVIL